MGSGKTVMLAGLGDLYTHPDEQGYFLRPKDQATADYVTQQIGRMRRGRWPDATAEDTLQDLHCELRQRSPRRGVRPRTVCGIAFLDFAGEVYRRAAAQGDDDARKALARLKDSQP